MLQVLKLLQDISAGKMDIATAIGSLGMDPQTLTTRQEFLNAISILANSMQSAEAGKAEVLLICGSPAIMNGKSCRIVAVFGDLPAS